MRLVHEGNRAKLAAIGDKVVSNTHGRMEWTLVGWQDPHKPGSTGRVTVRDSVGQVSTFYPSVVGLEFWPRPDRA